MKRALIIGAGIAGATAARFLAEDGCKVIVLEKKPLYTFYHTQQ